MTNNQRRLLIIPAIVLGVVIFMLMSGGEQAVPRGVSGEHATPVRFMTVQLQSVVPVAQGNGSVVPTRVWSAISQVQGRVVELPRQFRAGEVIQAGQLLLRVDDTDYLLAQAQAKAAIQATQAQLNQLTLQEGNLNASLKIEQALYDSAYKEWQRLQTLAKQGTVSSSQLDAQERAYLAQRQQLQNVKNSLALLPADRLVLQGQLAQQQAQLAQAELNLQRTTLVAPFNARLAEMNVELDQYVRVGEVLAVLDDMEQAEVKAQFSMDHFRQLFQPIDIKSMMAKGEMPSPHMLNLTAQVRLGGNGETIRWPAMFVRTDAVIDPQTRTVGAVVAVDKPYANAMPPLRPPLVKGMYVEVWLAGAAYAGQIAIPRHALHGDEVYLITDENRLERRKVKLQLRQSGFVTIASGVEVGERVVVSDLIPAVDGMLLAPVEDEALITSLHALLNAGIGE